MTKRSKKTVNIPTRFLSRMQDMLGEDYAAFQYALSEQSQSGLRVNTLKLLPDQYQAISPFELSPLSWCPTGFTYSADSQPGKHPHHSAGLFYLQEPSAMAVSEILAPLPGEKVLDLSAAPGGKTTHLAALMQNQGFLVANEIHPTRAWQLAENLERCGVRITAITNETPMRLAAHFGSYFDRVLLDAPCSGEGMFRKNQTARSQWSPEYVQSCALRQQDILTYAASLVKPGGSLVYSTCTFSPEENEMVIGNFLDRFRNFILHPFPKQPGFTPGVPWWAPQYHHLPLDKTIRIWPHHSVGEGHFIAHLKRIDQDDYDPPASPYHCLPIPPQLALHFEDFLDQTLTAIDLTHGLCLCGSYLYQLPSSLNQIANINWIHPGWWLGVFKKDRFEPSHALALGLTVSQAQKIHAFTSDDPDVIAYLRGESLPSSGDDGWTLVTIDGFPLGWGKRIRNLLKNAYPHGLRWR